MRVHCRHFESQTGLPKRQLYTETATQTAPAQAEVQQFRESIEQKTAPELMQEFKKQTAQLWQRQQVIYEIIEDFNENQSIPQQLKNQVIVEIAQELEKNQQLILSEEAKVALGNHLKPGKDFNLWLTKISLLAGTLGRMEEELNDNNASSVGKLSKFLKWMKVIMALVMNKPIKPPGNEAQQQQPNPVEAPPAEARELSATANQNIQVVENAANAGNGYLTLTVGGQKRLVKFDGSEVKNESGEVLQETNAIKSYLLKKRATINNISAMTGMNNASQKVSIAKSLLHHQKVENGQASPMDIALVVNDNWSWLMTQDPYKAQTPDQRFQALVATPQNAINPMIQALKNRNETVRTREKNLDNARRNVSQKFDELTTFSVSKLASGASKNAMEASLKSEVEQSVLQSRSQMVASGVYTAAMGALGTRQAQLINMTLPNAQNPFGTAENLRQVQQKVASTLTFLGQQQQALTAASPQQPR